MESPFSTALEYHTKLSGEVFAPRIKRTQMLRRMAACKGRIFSCPYAVVSVRKRDLENSLLLSVLSTTPSMIRTSRRSLRSA